MTFSIFIQGFSFIVNLILSIGLINYWLEKNKYKFVKLQEKRSELIYDLCIKFAKHLIDIKAARYFEEIKLNNLQEKKDKAYCSFNEFYNEYSVEKIFFDKSLEDIDKLLIPYHCSLSVWHDSGLNMDNDEVARIKSDSTKTVDKTIDLLNAKLVEEFKKIWGIK